ncbi:MAG: peptidylprolyl isomerase [Opitutales bacterium]|nr:peptidylprolyl isomerase [Opitutales bacterium]
MIWSKFTIFRVCTLAFLCLILSRYASGQNQGPAVTTPLPDQMLDQGGQSLDIDLTEFMSDPDVTSPAVQLDMTYKGKTEPIYLALFWDDSPKTAQNFVDYIEAGRFEGNFIHRSVPGFIIQGGGYRFGENSTYPRVPAFSSVQNEPVVSNTRGTVAMAKLENAPNSATSGWFINLANNASNLDIQNGGFTAFAKVLGNGMTIADEIADIPNYNYGGAFANLPLSRDPFPDDPLRTDFVETNASLIEPLQFSATSSDSDVVTVSVNDEGELTLTPSTNNAGEATITIEATDLDGAKRETTFAVDVLSNVLSFEDWQTANSFSDPEDALANNDPDKDGWINLLEYVLITDPLNPTHPDSRSEALGNGNFRFSIRKNVATDVRVESSIDLESWVQIWNSSQGQSGPGVIGYQTNEDLATITLRPNPFGLNLVPRYWRITVVEGDS